MNHSGVIAMAGSRSVAACVTLILLARGTSAGADAPLADAAEKQDRARIATLLKQGADVNAAQSDGMTALHWAAYHDDARTAGQLIGARASPRAANRYGVTPLSLACTNGNAELVELLLTAGADVNATLRGGETILMTAARTGKPAPVKALLARGSDPNAKDRHGQTALMWAAADGHAEVVSLLIAAKADFATPTPSGFTPLLFAAREGRLDVVRVLLKVGADANEVVRPKRAVPRGPKTGTSALHLAVENGHFELAIALVKSGADPNDQRCGYAPLHMISWVRKPNRGDSDDGDPPPIGSGKLTSLEFVKQLVALKADVNLAQKQGAPGRGVLGRVGATPLIAAASTSDVALVRTLLDLGADPKLANADGTTPLLAAAGVGVGAPEEAAGSEPEALDVIAMLMKTGADVNAVDRRGETAMHGAAYRNHPKVVEFLAASGAKIDVWNRPNRGGLTPLVIAEGHRPGLNFRPSPPTVAALHRVMLAAGVTPPKASPLPENLVESEYRGKSKKPR
ncbi:MAG TPA: ankyrin repeat domain-containing protein [Gemmataceae bacterium]|nr:ankyrin repeat domain-containing protein [Gemmataceae bacterium]